jgi:hypothetical protein
MSDAKALYDELVRKIDSDCAQKDYAGTLSLCQATGMQGGERPYGAMGQQFVFEKVFPNGDKVVLDFKWYDKSKPFSIQPDIHRFHVSYSLKEGQQASHSNAYEE